MAKNLMVLSSIAECSKALAWLKEVTLLEETLVELRGGVCPLKSQAPNAGQGILLGHQLVPLGHNKLHCSACHRVFHSKRQALTPIDCIVFSKLDPRVPFGQGAEELLWHSQTMFTGEQASKGTNFWRETMK